MGQVVLNGRPLGDQEIVPMNRYLGVDSPYLRSSSRWRVPIILNSKMTENVNINGYNYPPATSNCVLYFPGLPGQGSTIWDRSDKGNNGTITGATWVRLPSGLWVLSFDGNDLITVGTTVNALLAGDRTFVIWFKYDAATERTLVSNASGTVGSGTHISIGRNSAGRLDAWYNVGGTYYLAYATGLSADTWYHLVSTFNAASQARTLYINGLSVWLTSAGAAAAATTTFTIGRTAYAASGFMSGAIGSVSGYNRIWTRAEAIQDYIQTRWRFQ